MKYNEQNKPLLCYMTTSTWYTYNKYIKPVGVLWHSTGANNPALCRYVLPSDTAKNKEEMLRILGKNQYRNDWNHIYYNAGVNAFIGKLANGEVTTVNVGPWNKKPGGCGNGKKGSCNDGWIQFEICEDNLCDKTYFNKVYTEACELTAYLCKMYDINPKGTVKFNGVTVPTILCHADSNRLGLGTAHVDVEHWFSKYGKTMQDVRNDVQKLLEEDDDDNMTQEQFNKMFITAMNAYRKTLQDNDCGTWSKDDREWAIKKGLIQGDGNNYQWEDFVSREQLMAIFHRFSKLQ